MSETPSPSAVLDAFLSARARTVSGPTTDRDRAVITGLRAFAESRGAPRVDELTAYRLRHDGRLARTEHERAAVLGVIEHVTGFFGALDADAADAAEVIRALSEWLTGCDLVDAEVAGHLERYTHLFDTKPVRTGT